MADADSVHVHHGFDYIEIPVTDIRAAESFYAAAFGWRFTSYGPAYLGIVLPNGHEGGGISEVGEMPHPGTTGPLVVLFSRDLEATRASVLAAGGTLSRDIFAFPDGRRFHFLDPSGNELGVWAFASDD